ncbi:hypothetical protein HMPREF9630_00058 [Peptoanaerobacter stomatis]|uniref:N-acetyltransferase domain-containing protein n=1 Tax=Peptoanaerobacter stomatis TaxID=796937 RepID=V9HLG1_9FIRM|nr:GNAT family N-acetyltransferase [Peptoanaerobacter stomatis]EHL18333.1 hypothetical protein HMPREF9630_00058 [Peptoanaerobacter stomatis]
MKYYIDEMGEHIKLHNMRSYETKLTQGWGKHKDRLYADYDFPSLSMVELVEWLELKTSKGRAIISISTMNDRIIGYISLRNTNKFFKRGELGIVLNPDEINKGYGTEALKTFINWYFKKLKYKKLFLSVAMYNDRAYRVYRKLGFKSKYTFWERFDNEEINPFLDEEYEDIKRYFKKVKDITYVKCMKMELSTLSTR